MPAITNPIDLLRLEIGDTVTGDALFTDDELTVFLDRWEVVSDGGTVHNLLAAAADACQALATRFARDFDFATEGQSFNRGQRSEHFAELATTLRRRSGGGLATGRIVSSVKAAIADAESSDS